MCLEERLAVLRMSLEQQGGANRCGKYVRTCRVERAAADRSAQTGVRRRIAGDGNDEPVFASACVVWVLARAGEEDPVQQRERARIARADAEDDKRLFIGHDLDGLTVAEPAQRLELREDEVRTMLGTIDRDAVYRLLQALAAADAAALLAEVGKADEYAPDYAALLADLLTVLQRIALAQQLPDAIDDTFGDREAVLQLAGDIPSEDVQLYYQIGLLGRRDLSLAPDARGGFEMIMLRMLAFRPVAEGQSRETGARAASRPPAAVKPVDKRDMPGLAEEGGRENFEGEFDVKPGEAVDLRPKQKPATDEPEEVADGEKLADDG